MKNYAFPQIPRKKLSPPTLTARLLGDLSMLFDREGQRYHRIAVSTGSPAHWHEAMRLYEISMELEKKWKRQRKEEE